MTLREELMGIVRPIIRPNMNSDLAVFEQLLAAVKQKLSYTEAETVERCANRVDAYRGVAQKQTAWTWGEVNNLLVDLREQVRALSPDPHARERWELEASAVEAKAIRRGHSSLGVKLTTAEVLFVQWLDRRIAELERQLAALPEVKK